MNWIDESRRKAFEQKVGRQSQSAGELSELDNLLPIEVTQRSIRIGNELILPYEDALAAMRIAVEHSIAILGFEAGEIREDGFQVIDYSGYWVDVMLKPDWKEYVAAMNSRAEDWLKTHQYGHNHGYTVSATSEREFRELPYRIK